MRLDFKVIQSLHLFNAKPYELSLHLGKSNLTSCCHAITGQCSGLCSGMQYCVCVDTGSVPRHSLKSLTCKYFGGDAPVIS
ncbi:hypothetical protein [Rickettsia amblyommatis]|uniref:Uncharacterized protein n=1 Tax=Rickettsia amblyommatis (strain GAT-30V) TaxID=1105111 RepID=H8K6C2_RICAG|nr:hypothetical protein [Rickettsia amblyommatis]AFC70433.1 hypothetical protein MCE_08570 [Rickettsia amblyommatis str. GAT-30V]